MSLEDYELILQALSLYSEIIEDDDVSDRLYNLACEINEKINNIKNYLNLT